MKRSSPIRSTLLAIAAAATGIAFSAPASAAQRTFTITWTSQSMAAATGLLIIEDTICQNPGTNFATNPPGCLVAFDITITGAASGNGFWKLVDFADAIFASNSALDYNANLIGQGLSDLNLLGMSPAPSGIGPFVIRPDGTAGMDDLTVTSVVPSGEPPPPGPEFPFEADAQQCADAIAAAGAKYFAARHKSLHGCRSGLMKGTPLFTDKAKTTPMEAPSGCPTEFKAAAQIAKAGAKLRSAIAKKCTDALLANLFACGATVDALVDSTGTMGCMVSSTDANVATVLDAEFGF